MDPKQQPTPSSTQEPTEPNDQPTTPTAPTTPLGFNDDVSLSTEASSVPTSDTVQPTSAPEAPEIPEAGTVPGQSTTTTSEPAANDETSSPTPLSIPVYDSTADGTLATDSTLAGRQASGDFTPGTTTDTDTTSKPSSETTEPESTSVTTDATTEPSLVDSSESPVVPDAEPSPEVVPPAPSDAGITTPPAGPIPPASGNGPHNGRKWVIILLVILLVLGAGIALTMVMLKKNDNKKDAKTPVKVGFLMALTGGSSSMGYGTNKGIQLAKKQLGAENIEIVQSDSKCDPKVAPEAIKRLIAQKVVAIIGDGCSSAATAALPAANNAKIPMISPSASSPSLSIPNDYFFRVVPSDNFQGAFLAQAIFDKGLRKVAVFYTNESYGSSMSKVFKEKFESLGGKIVSSVSAESDVIDLTSQMNTLKASNPEAVFFAPNSVVSATAAIKVAREVGIKAPFFGADVYYDTSIIKDVGTATEGMTLSSFPTGSKSFKQALLNEYQVADQLYGAPQAYDALNAIHIAIQKGATTGEQIAKLLPSISFNGVSAHISFDENGEISEKSYKYDLLQIKSGAFTTVE